MLTGGLGSEKKWYVSAAEPGHLGVGPAFEGAVGNKILGGRLIGILQDLGQNMI